MTLSNNRPGGIVEFVFKFAGQLLDCVFRRHQSDCGSILVHHNGHLAAALLEIAQQAEGGLGLRHDEDIAHDLAQLEFDEGRGNRSHSRSLSGTPPPRLLHREPDLERPRALPRRAEKHQARKVFGIDHANDMLRAARFVVDRYAGVHMLDHLRAGLLQSACSMAERRSSGAGS